LRKRVSGARVAGNDWLELTAIKNVGPVEANGEQVSVQSGEGFLMRGKEPERGVAALR
jgi:hypothetical protein